MQRLSLDRLLLLTRDELRRLTTMQARFFDTCWAAWWVRSGVSACMARAFVARGTL